MAYGDFTKEQLEIDFGIRFEGQKLFPNIQEIEPSNWLKTSLIRAKKVGVRSEKSRSELMVSPILVELGEINDYNFSSYSGEQLNVDKERGLSGECDFILSKSLIKRFVTAPIFCITEAEKHDLEKGLIQVSAQVLGAYYFNQKSDNQDIKVIYGASTNGYEWVFLKLEDNTIVVDTEAYSLAELPELLGILQFIVESTKSK